MEKVEIFKQDPGKAYTVQEFLLEFKNRHIKMWWDTSIAFPRLEEVFDKHMKKKNEKELDKYIKSGISDLRNLPKANEDRQTWREDLKNRSKDAGKYIFGLTDEYLQIFTENDFAKATKDFLNEVRNFDSKCAFEDIFQAIRNVWIMNSIQILLGRGVQLTPSIFAYSMLYPYTDNYLDDPNVSDDEKVRINQRFKRRLKGEVMQPANFHEQQLFTLVSMIESQYARLDYQGVYDSLVGIHQAQENSLLQQKKVNSPYETDILGISIEKGGMSVLADAYLIRGELFMEEAAFMFGFGVFLQLADDLQDIYKDIENNHMTIFSQTAKKWPLDNITNRLINFLYQVIDSDQRFSNPDLIQLKSLIKYNCMFLIIHAIAKNRRMYSKEYIKKIEVFSRFSFDYLDKLYQKLQKEYKTFNKKDKEYKIDDIILSLIK
jgi:hypothetical protein